SGKRTSRLFDPNSSEPFKLSRSKIDKFIQCPRCFYIDIRLGVGQPPSFPFNLNSAVDLLLKNEFDGFRGKQEPHPLMTQFGVDAIPFLHPDMDQWRNSLGGGIGFLHEPTNLYIYGGVDDVWVNPAGELIVVDYKATSKNSKPTLDAPWQVVYKRQMEVYQWLFKKNNFPVSNIGYFVYCNGKRNLDKFDSKLEFDIEVIPYVGNTDWIETTLASIKKCLMSNEVPEAGQDCDFCTYRGAISSLKQPTK
ncbi:MAG: PD-(D/E)XK nuclease family protein, partial [Patescibacteria group bacterium]|nr:PD-(D/E)XK nuclease family protein [Patescibacteria group bacterium]